MKHKVNVVWPFFYMYLESLPDEKKNAGHVLVAFSDFVCKGDTFVA